MGNMKRSKGSVGGISAPRGVGPETGASAVRIFEPVTGYVDIFGYSSAAGGWLFSGWVPRPLRTSHSEPVDCLIQFEQSQSKSRAALAFYQRDDLNGAGIGVIAFVPGSSRASGNLQFHSFFLDGIAYQAQAGPGTKRLQEPELVDQVRQTLFAQAFANHSRDHLLSVTSRPGFTGQDTLSSLSQPILLEIDDAILCPPDGVLLKGWHLGTPGSVRSIRVRSGHLGGEIRLSDSIRIARSDVINAIGRKAGFSDTRCGFISYVPFAISNGDVSYLQVELENGEVGFKRFSMSMSSGLDAIKAILEGIDARYGEIDGAFDNVLGPAISALNAARLEKPAAADVVQLGAISKNPKYSLIIPLYGRVDFVEYQMALFSRHGAINQTAEIIYVLDDPERRRELEVLASSTYERFRIPFSLLILPNNLGFAPASNAGLRHARGDFICFMNSDIFPITTDWMEGLIAILRQNPSIGVVGPRLLYEDGSIQHEGCSYRQIEEFGNWTFIEHQNKGRRPSHDGQGIRICELITGACMVMRRSLALDLGGFDEAFIIGDFEDSDLCLKVRSRGLSCAVADEFELYHLERKSQAAPSQSWRMNLTLYNAWVHQRRWGPSTNAARKSPVG
jgi:GT2 family glycosyltransferase